MEMKERSEDSKPARDAQKKQGRDRSKSSLDAMNMFPPEKKMKKKIEEAEKDLCGICLAEESVNARGKMDSCEHYFCFACILEWAKVETRCPTCRQRFTTISRPCGFRGRGRTLNLPLRNQVHIPPDDDNEAVEDPYQDVFCTKCNGREDDSLLLLCDLCDSAAHTYCVGLGRTVPTGEWYCPECEASGIVSSDREEDDENDDFTFELYDDDITSRSISTEITSTTKTVEKVNQQPVLPSLLLSRHATSASSERPVYRRVICKQAPRLSNVARAFASQSSASASEAKVSNPASLPPSGPSRTLSGRRLLQERIQVMRENWKSLQHGELQFSSQRFCFSDKFIDRSNECALPALVNQHKENRQKPDNQIEIDRAWAMMERAKSFGGGNDPGLDNYRKVERSHLSVSSSQISQKVSKTKCATRPIERTSVDSRVSSTSSAKHNNYVLNNRISSVGFTPLQFSQCSTTSSAKLMPQISDSSKISNQAPTTSICGKEHVARLSGCPLKGPIWLMPMQRRRS